MQTIKQRRVLATVDSTVNPVGVALAKRIIASIDTGSDSITNPINWPNSAVFGVSYKLHDRQFPQVEHSTTVVYFDNVAQLMQWLEDKRDWIKGTDYDFSMDYQVYTWDWGPVFKYAKSM